MSDRLEKRESVTSLSGASIPAVAYVFVGFSIILVLFVPHFATPANIVNVLRVASILALAACGQAIVISTGGIDFSVSSSVALTSVLTVYALSSGWSAPWAFLFGCGSSVAIGAANGVLVAFFRLPPFLVTLGMLIGVHGLASVIVGGMPLEAPSFAAFGWLARGTIAGIPVPIVLALVGAVVTQILFAKTPLGRRWCLVGANPRAAELAGIDVKTALIRAYIAASLLYAVAGAILTSRVGSGQPNLYPNLSFEAIAACAVGGISLSGGKANGLQAVLGTAIIAFLSNAIVLLNISVAAQYGLVGAIIIAAVLLQKIRIGRRLRHAA
jgi:ribose transport system permease protein